MILFSLTQSAMDTFTATLLNPWTADVAFLQCAHGCPLSAAVAILRQTNLSHAYCAKLRSLAWLWGKPWLFGTNMSRPHLSTYITIQESQEGAVLVREWSWVLTMAAKHEAFSRTEEANRLQFSLTMEVLPSNNLKMGSICQGSRYQVG